jgi:hypothetical protein
MKKVLMMVVVLVIAATQSGCFSYMAYQHNKGKVMAKKIRASGNEAAIKAFNNGDTTGIGIDVGALETLDSPEAVLLQAGGAVLDAAILYGVKEGVDSLNQSNSERNNSLTVNNGGNGNVNVTITQNDTTTQNTTDTRSYTSDSSANSHNDNSNR